jgi:flagellin-specific chaperone FliS
VAANVEDHPEPIERSIKVISELRDGWAQIERQQKQPDPPAELQTAA